jgi:hypothetical protein
MRTLGGLLRMVRSFRRGDTMPTEPAWGKVKKIRRGSDYFCGRCKMKVEPGTSYFNFPPKGSAEVRCAEHEPTRVEARLVTVRHYLQHGNIAEAIKYVDLALSELHRGVAQNRP